LEFENQQYYNCEIELDTGEKYKVHANWLHNNNLDHWQGWECDAGYNMLSINKDLDVYSAFCKNEKLGNLLNGWKIFNKPSTCLRARCTGCTEDLLIAKREISTSEE